MWNKVFKAIFFFAIFCLSNVFAGKGKSVRKSRKPCSVCPPKEVRKKGIPDPNHMSNHEHDKKRSELWHRAAANSLYERDEQLCKEAIFELEDHLFSNYSDISDEFRERLEHKILWLKDIMKRWQ